jgi:hypothetical protein
MKMGLDRVEDWDGSCSVFITQNTTWDFLERVSENETLLPLNGEDMELSGIPEMRVGRR